jgi:V8-like Glu-specific endopeptidase
MATIVLDAGHGGCELRGRSSPEGVRFAWGGREKDIVLALAREAARRLGSDAVLTRERDVNLSFGERIEIARRTRADAFVSLHANAERRTEMFVHTEASPRSLSLARALGRTLGGSVSAGALAVLSPERHRVETAACLVEIGDVLKTPHDIVRIGGAVAQALKFFNNPPQMNRVDDVRAPPFRYIARIRTRFSNATGWGHSEGSGVLIAANIILTTAHNLVDRRPTLGVTFADATKLDISVAGWGPFSATGYWVDDRWMQAVMNSTMESAAAYDYGLIQLQAGVGDVAIDGAPMGAWPLQAVDPTQLGDVFVAGWPSEDCVRDLAAKGSTPLGYPVLMCSRGTVERPNPGERVFAHDADTCVGESGGPIWYEDQGARILAGIQQGTGTFTIRETGARLDRNVAVAITSEVAAAVERQIAGPSAWRISGW